MKKTAKNTEVNNELLNEKEDFEINPEKLDSIEEIKENYNEIKQELKSTFCLPKYGLKNRTMNVMTRIDEETSRILDALVALELAPSRSSAAAYLINDAIRKDKEKYMKILESYETIKLAKKKAQYSFYKSLQEESDEKNKEEKED
jgi:tyrosyl-tRNA synthetase